MDYALRDNEENNLEVLNLPRDYRQIVKAPIYNYAQNKVYHLLDHIKNGLLIVNDPWGRKRSFGVKSELLPTVKIEIYNRNFFQRIIKGGTLALGDSYLDGWWDVDNNRLVDFFRLTLGNRLESYISSNLFVKIQNKLREFSSNPFYIPFAKRAIEHHYDLGNDFYKLMLDRSLTYSCGYQEQAEDSLEKMQEQKYRRICKKLNLEKGGKLLDIGCGWGGMLFYAAKNFPNITAVGVTLSNEQYAHVSQQIKEQGLENRIQVFLQDYRLLEGSYDYIVSIGMFEHVGLASYPVFFKKLTELIKPEGVGLLHSIGTEDPPHQASDPWIRKHIFPGFRLPRLEELSQGMRQADLLIGHIENWKPHYAITLNHWQKNFVKNWTKISSLDRKFNQRFFRMWDYYLQLCEAGFMDSTMELYQVLFCKRNSWKFPNCFKF